MKFSIEDFFSKCDQIRSKLLDIIFDNFENCGLNMLIYLQKLFKLTMLLASKSLWRKLSRMENNSVSPYTNILRKII